MKIENINMIINQVNSINTKNDKNSLVNTFTETLKKTDSEDEFINELFDKDDNEEELIIPLIEILLNENFDEIKIENGSNDLADFIKKINKDMETNTNKILSRNEMREYFQGNDTKEQEIIRLLEDIKNNNDTNVIAEIVDKLKERLLINNKSYHKQSLENNENIYKEIKMSFEGGDNSRYFNEGDINNIKMTDITRVKGDDNLTMAVDKDIDILKEIAKEDNNNLIILDNKITTTTEVGLSKDTSNRPLEISASNLTYDIVESINYIKSNDIQELRLNINPKELGEISIKLIKSSKDTKLSLVVSKEDIYSLVNKNILEISKHLEALDIKVNEVSVEIKSDNQNFFSDNLNQQFKDDKNQHRNNKKKNTGNLEIEKNKSEREDNINLLA